MTQEKKQPGQPRSKRKKPEPDNMVTFTIERIHYDNRTGEKLSKPKILKRSQKVYDQFVKEAGRLGYTVTVL